MRTFNLVKQFGVIGGNSADSGKNNEAILFINRGAAATSITVHAFGTQGYTAAVGPFQIATNQTFIFPAAAYGWTAGNTGIRAYELF
jgi:hypothetical protein